MKDLLFFNSVVQMPAMSLPVRTVAVSTPIGRFLISPGSKLTEEELRQAGEVDHILALNLWHCAGVPHAAKVFPKAKVWGPPGARRQKPEMPWSEELSEQSWPFGAHLKLVVLEGAPDINECVIAHADSGALFMADLCFNLTQARGVGAWLILKMMGTYRRFAVSRLFVQKIADKDAFRKSLSRVFAMSFSDIVMAHGEVLKNGRDEFLKALNERGLAPKP